MSDADLTDILRDWSFEPGRINVRIIDAADGRNVMQIRLELGILQLELEGRPDGGKPHGRESLLAHQIERLKEYTETNAPDGFVLSPEECRALREEAVQYYHRYMALFALEEYELVVRDTERNLRVIELCQEYAASEGDQRILLQFLPHHLMMRARALAASALAGKEPKLAARHLDEGIEQVEAAYRALGRTEAPEELNEIQLLRGMREALVPRLPMSQRVELEERLRAALDAENYELAAILRDELRMMAD